MREPAGRFCYFMSVSPPPPLAPSPRLKTRWGSLVVSKTKPSPPKNDLPQTWLLFGEDPRFFEDAAKRWTDRWAGELGAISLPAPGLTVQAFNTEVNSLPFLKERQVVRITHLEEASPDLVEEVASYLQNPSPTTALLLEYLGSPPKTGAKKGPSRAESSWARLFASVPAEGCQPTSARAYAAKRLRDEGFQAEPAVFEALDEWSCREVAKVASALDLLLLYRAEERALKEGDVAALLGAGGSPPRRDLQDAFVARDARKFSALLVEVERDPEVLKDGQGTALAFLGMLAKQVRALLVARGVTDSGQGREAAAQALAGDPLKLHSFVAGKILNALPKWPEGEIREALGALYRLDLAIKGMESGPPWSMVERHVATILGTPGGQAPSRGPRG
jgi:DNA polymerase III delta subunit